MSLFAYRGITRAPNNQGIYLHTDHPMRGRIQTHLPEISFGQFMAGLEAYQAGALIQDAFPFLTLNECELMLSGLTGAEFDALYAEDEGEGA